MIAERLIHRAAGYFRRHPVLLLLCFTPGIPEYLSGSSSVAFLVVFPGGTLLTLLFLGLNLGLYGPGVLLLRELWVGWGRGWGRLLLLGTAYGLLEEGTALSTLFDPNASVVGGLGHYGRIAGVNWVWLIGVIGVHVVLSVGVPILLLGLSLPETRGRPLLTRRERTTAITIFLADALFLAFISGYWRVQFAWLLGAAVVAVALGYAASRWPEARLDPATAEPRFGPLSAGLLGLAYFPLLLLVPVLGQEAAWPAAATGALDLAGAVVLFETVRRGIGRRHNGAQLTALGFGITLPIVGFGFLAEAHLPLVLLLDAVYGLFFWALWSRWRDDRGSHEHAADGGPPPSPWVGRESTGSGPPSPSSGP
ncbi:MAG TPA: hypothetical protein VML53_05050 [Thermoplasmata archaeon]|nr:hypothetical protein [Thermoplasmata archaeon]